MSHLVFHCTDANFKLFGGRSIVSNPFSEHDMILKAGTLLLFVVMRGTCPPTSTELVRHI